jgi:hypothetical protein
MPAAAILAGPMWQVVPITQFLDSPKFDPETKRVASHSKWLAKLFMAREALQLGDEDNLVK